MPSRARGGARCAIESGVYIVWRGRNGADCARVGGKSRCFCGCPLAAHAPISAGNPQPPPCRACACPAAEYVPSRPEEVGMWWLPRRKGFDVRAWRAPCRCKHGHDSHDPVTRRCTLCGCSCFKSAYACLGCDRGQEEHETCFELASERTAANRPVGDAFFPLQARRPRCARPCSARGPPPPPPPPAVEASPEELYERGAIGADEYHRQVATTGELAAGFPRGGLSAAFPPVGGGGSGGGGSGGTAVARRGGAAAHAPPTVADGPGAARRRHRRQLRHQPRTAHPAARERLEPPVGAGARRPAAGGSVEAIQLIEVGGCRGGAAGPGLLAQFRNSAKGKSKPRAGSSKASLKRKGASLPTMRPTTLLLLLLSTASAVQIVSYDDGVDEDALVDIRVDAAAAAPASFLQKSSQRHHKTRRRRCSSRTRGAAARPSRPRAPTAS